MLLLELGNLRHGLLIRVFIVDGHSENLPVLRQSSDLGEEAVHAIVVHWNWFAMAFDTGQCILLQRGRWQASNGVLYL